MSRSTNRAVKNAGWIIGCKLVKAILTVIITSLTARYFGPSNYGLINYASGIVAFAAPVMRLGFDAILVHEIVREPEREGETLGTALILNAISSVLCIIGVTAFAAIANPNENETVVVCALYSITLLVQALEMVQYWFQAKLMSRCTAISMLVAYVCISVVQVVLLASESPIFWFVLSHTLEFLVIDVCLYSWYKKYDGQALKFSMPRAKRMLSIGKYYVLSSLMFTVYQQIGKIMLKDALGNAAVGIYSAAATCATMASFVFAAVLDSGRPVIFEEGKRGAKHFEDALSKLYTVIIYSSVCACLLITLFAPLIIHIMYGAEYKAAVSALRIMVWFTTFSYMGAVNDMWIIAQKKQKYLLAINSCGAVSNIILNAILIPICGVVGVAIATVCTQFIVNVFVGFLLKPIRRPNMIMLKSLHPKNAMQILHSVIGRR